MPAKPTTTYATLDEWIAREAIPFSVDSPASFNAAVDKMVNSLDESVELVGFGEPTHGSEEFVVLRNRLFQRLVEAHGFSAIAVESSFPRARVVNEYVAGAAGSFEDIQETGFSHGFGRLDANRALIEWMRTYNADPANRVKLKFYGFDSPTEMVNTDSPRQLLLFAVDFLTSIDPADGQGRRERMEMLLGEDSDWENPAAMMDPTKSIGLSPAAAALRIETEDFISELRMRRPELVASSGEVQYLEAVHYAQSARHLLNYHAAIARTSSNRIAECLGIRDLTMADNLAYIVERERPQGRVLAFAHNSHLKLGKAEWQLGPQLLAWWPAGSHLKEALGSRYAVIGCGAAVSNAHGLDQPEAGTLEARLAATSGPARFIPTHRGQGLPAAQIAALPTRSTKNPGYFPFSSQSITDFDWLALMDSVR